MESYRVKRRRSVFDAEPIDPTAPKSKEYDALMMEDVYGAGERTLQDQVKSKKKQRRKK